MDRTPLWLLATAFCSIALTASLCRWWFGQSLRAMQKRLEQSETARQSAHERSQQARSQIAQLTKMVADLQRRHKNDAQARRERMLQLEEAVPSLLDEPRPAMPPHGFADTQPM